MILPQKAGTKERAGGGVQSEARRREEKPCKCAGRRDSEGAETLRPKTRSKLLSGARLKCSALAQRIREEQIERGGWRALGANGRTTEGAGV
ncbi:hypothetical protein NDU88_008245 [Pleurodeles waltl]|uniref:Uncharacterized protein n=1 Tax=Pleurodeles waltl TaxID=8319 RepID=A0AAV7PPU2_PLEWA|nr:hypothetical protein NDU88_008245 [Pleurodeles waltl]